MHKARCCHPAAEPCAPSPALARAPACAAAGCSDAWVSCTQSSGTGPLSSFIEYPSALSDVLQVRNVLMTICLFCGPMLVTFSFLNTVAWIYRSTAALPFGTIVIIFILWALITLPLTVLGGIAGKNRPVSATTCLG